jgi:hypothetical protein
MAKNGEPGTSTRACSSIKCFWWYF